MNESPDSGEDAFESRQVVPRRVEVSDEFRDQRADLEADPEIARVIESLVRKACTFAEWPSAGANVRVWRSRAFAGVPALRVFYEVGPETIRFLLVEPYDEFED